MKCDFCENPKYVERINSKGILENFCTNCIEKLVAGSYQLIDEEEIGRLAINYDRKESSTDIMEGKQIIQAFENAGIKNCTFKSVDNGQSTTQLKLDKPFEYWRFFVILALLFILTEMVLLKFWK